VNFAVVVLAPALSTMHTLALSPSHTTITLPYLSNVTPHVAIAAVMAIAITTVTTTTKVLCSSRHRSWDSAIAPLEVLEA
jgi:hypothetical protein